MLKAYVIAVQMLYVDTLTDMKEDDGNYAVEAAHYSVDVHAHRYAYGIPAIVAAL